MHSKEQDMNCPGCDKLFTHMGALIAHIELTECRSIVKKDTNFNFEESRKEKEAVYENQRDVRNYVDFGRSEGEPGADNGPKPMLANYAMVQVAATSPAECPAKTGTLIIYINSRSMSRKYWDVDLVSLFGLEC
jgi:hypothetical protein